MSILTSLIVLATEGGIPAESPLAKLAVPIGILIFVGPVYLLLRSNLGTRLGYLVLGATLWGSTFLFALFWTFGAPGTPAFTGPQNLPGQELNEYLPIWVPLAQDAAAVTEEGSPYAVIAGYPEGFSETRPSDLDEETVETGIGDIQSFFASLAEPYTKLLNGLEEPVATQYATADNGRPIIAVTYAGTCQLGTTDELPEGCAEVGEIAPEGSEARGEDTTLFAFFDAGNPAFPSYLMLGATFVLFVLHLVLLARDERRQRAELEAEAEAAVVDAERKDPVPA